MSRPVLPAERPVSDCRLLIDPPAPGTWNMAVDEAILEHAASGGGCTLRLYRWSEPTLSLGYFQAYGDRLRHEASRNCPVVRRASGGGAILHDVEITYCLVVPRGHSLADQPTSLYHAVHACVIEVFGCLGTPLRLWGENAEAEHRPFLCFQRRSPGDIVSGPIKVVGSAQRRRRGAVLQHGSILLGRSAAAPELAGLSELAATDRLALIDACRRQFDRSELVGVWLRRLGGQLGLKWTAETLTAGERERASHLAQAKYGSLRWTQDRRYEEPR